MSTKSLGAMTSDQIGYVYYNVATGEMIQTAAPTQLRDQGSPVWVNEGYDQCTFAEWFFTGLRDGTTGEDSYFMDYGEVAPNSVVDCVTFLVATSVLDPEEDGAAGHELTLTYFDGVDIGIIGSPNAVPYFGLTVTDVPGSADGTIAGWLLTIDFAGTGTAWEVGDADGVDDSGNGFNSGYGPLVDLNGDGNANFAHGFNIAIPAGDVGLSGVGLVVPPGDLANTLGEGDNFGLYNGDWDFLAYDGLYWFGGYNCTGGAGFLWVPWAGGYVGMYGGGGVAPCPADFNNDTLLDFFDVQLFLAAFSANDPSADFNNDNLWDFFDVQLFLAAFSAGCP
jgi:hypothetical protein